MTESTAYARYDQYVCVTYRLYRLGGVGPSWALASSLQRCAWISGASTAVDIMGASFGAAPQFAYSVDMTVTWQLSNGTVVGSKYVDYAHRADYVCSTGKCVTGSSPKAGGYILLAL